jgi:hypothetical protein
VSGRFDPYALLQALEDERASYVVIGGFARVVQGSGERTAGIDIVPSMREDNLRHIGRALAPLAGDEAVAGLARLADGAPLTLETDRGRLAIVPMPWGTRGYDDIRIRANRENLGRGVRPRIASVVDLARMLEASAHEQDRERLLRLRRMMELERARSRRRGLSLER